MKFHCESCPLSVRPSRQSMGIVVVACPGVLHFR